MFEGLKNFVDGVSTSEETKKSAKKKTKKFHHHEKTITERLEDDVLNQKSDSFDKFYSVVAIIMAVIIIGCLLFTVSFLPSFGDPSNPANNIVSEKYIVDGVKDTHAINLVAGMILDYRAFDTLGESTVLFIAASAVIILLFANKTKKEHQSDIKPYESTIKDCMKVLTELVNSHPCNEDKGEGITVEKLAYLCLLEVRKGNGQKHVLLSSDDEINEGHTLYSGFIEFKNDYEDLPTHDNNDVTHCILLA